MNIKNSKLCLIVLAALQGCSEEKKTTLANPASVYCVKVGGKVVMAKHPDGGVYGICVFKDNKQCEEWALFRGKCPVGGLEPNKKPPS